MDMQPHRELQAQNTLTLELAKHRRGSSACNGFNAFALSLAAASRSINVPCQLIHAMHRQPVQVLQCPRESIQKYFHYFSSGRNLGRVRA